MIKTEKERGGVKRVGANQPPIAEQKMASMNIFTPVPLTAGGRNQTSYFPRRRPNSVPFAANSPESPPEIELEFIGVSFVRLILPQI